MAVDVSYKDSINEELRTQTGIENRFGIRFFDFAGTPLSFTGSVHLDKYEFEGVSMSGRYNCTWDLYGQLISCDAPFGLNQSGKLHIGDIIDKVKEIAL